MNATIDEIAHTIGSRKLDARIKCNACLPSYGGVVRERGRPRPGGRDGNEPDAPHSGRARATRRASQSLRWRTVSSWGRTGTAARSSAKRIVGKVGSAGSAHHASWLLLIERANEVAPQRRKGHRRRTRPCDHEQAHPTARQGFIENRGDATTDTIAGNRRSDRLADRDADERTTKVRLRFGLVEGQ